MKLVRSVKGMTLKLVIIACVVRMTLLSNVGTWGKGGKDVGDGGGKDMTGGEGHDVGKRTPLADALLEVDFEGWWWSWISGDLLVEGRSSWSEVVLDVGGMR